MDPRELAILQAQRGQATRIPGREVQLRGLGAAAGPVAPLPPPPPPASPAGAQESWYEKVPWWAWALIAAGLVQQYARRKR